MFHPPDGFGGAERTMVNLLTHLSRERLRVVLVASPEVFGKLSVDAFYPRAEVGVAEGFAGFRRSLADARRLCAIARRERCQVFFGMLHYGAIMAVLCRFWSRFRLWTIASPRTPSFQALQWHIKSGGENALLWRILIHAFCRFSDRLVVASKGLKDESVHRYGAKPHAVWVIPNGIDDQLMRHAMTVVPRSLDEGRLRIVTSGRLAPEKDLQTLIQAFAKVRACCDVVLEIIGAGPEQARLEALVAELGIAADVAFLGFQQQPFERVKAADLFVHTALFEGFGNVLLEAMACGVPVIATDCDFGPREIVQDGRNGRLVRVSDPEHLAEVIMELLVDPMARKRLAEGGLASLSSYSAERMAQRYEQVFLECPCA
ncbi:MAG: glycosyltransferase [Gammaproteobacteria bacterium]|nr:glycosyltransferase [Gammaproteobacteria bacterium]